MITQNRHLDIKVDFIEGKPYWRDSAGNLLRPADCCTAQNTAIDRVGFRGIKKEPTIICVYGIGERLGQDRFACVIQDPFPAIHNNDLKGHERLSRTMPFVKYKDEIYCEVSEEQFQQIIQAVPAEATSLESHGWKEYIAGYAPKKIKTISVVGYFKLTDKEKAILYRHMLQKRTERLVNI